MVSIGGANKTRKEETEFEATASGPGRTNTNKSKRRPSRSAVGRFNAERLRGPAVPRTGRSRRPTLGISLVFQLQKKKLKQIIPKCI